MFHKLRHDCRSNLNKYLIRAFSRIPLPEGVRIADLGCGSGVSALAIAEYAECLLYAADQDRESLDHFKKKLASAPGGERVVVIHSPVEKLNLPGPKMDVVLAEGLFNMIGFAKGLDLASGFLAARGYLIIHDELTGAQEKLRLIASRNFEVLDSFALDREVWRKEYFDCLARQMERLKDASCGSEQEEAGRLLETELQYFRDKPERCVSIYYVLQKQAEPDAAS